MPLAKSSSYPPLARLNEASNTKSGLVTALLSLSHGRRIKLMLIISEGTQNANAQSQLIKSDTGRAKKASTWSAQQVQTCFKSRSLIVSRT